MGGKYSLLPGEVSKVIPNEGSDVFRTFEKSAEVIVATNVVKDGTIIILENKEVYASCESRKIPRYRPNRELSMGE